jgi:hypothetical protein
VLEATMAKRKKPEVPELMDAVEALQANAVQYRKVLRDLVDACAYVKPFAGEILSEGENVTVKNMRNAMKFCAAIERAQKLLGE